MKDCNFKPMQCDCLGKGPSAGPKESAECCTHAAGEKPLESESAPCGEEGTNCCETGKMEKCLRACRRLPLAPLALGSLFLALGYYLDPEVTRVLWMLLSGTLVLGGILGFFAMRGMIKKSTRCA